MLTYALALLAAELIAGYVRTGAGSVVHGLVLAALLADASVLATDVERPFLYALAVAPLLRMLSLALPLRDQPAILWWLTVPVPTLVAGLAVVRLLHFPLRAVGLTVRQLPTQLAVACTGFGLGFIEYGIVRPRPLIQQLTLRDVILPALVLCTGLALAQELVFRGLMLKAFRSVSGRFTIAFVALLSALTHVGYRSIPDVMLLFAVGVLYGWVVSETGSILGVTLSQGIALCSLYLVIPFISIGGLVPAGPSGPARVAVAAGRPADRVAAQPRALPTGATLMARSSIALPEVAQDDFPCPPRGQYCSSKMLQTRSIMPSRRQR